MEVLKRLLGLEFIGWVLIALAAFGFSELTFKFSCKWCSCGKGSKDCELPVPSKRKKK